MSHNGKTVAELWTGAVAGQGPDEQAVIHSLQDPILAHRNSQDGVFGQDEEGNPLTLYDVAEDGTDIDADGGPTSTVTSSDVATKVTEDKDVTVTGTFREDTDRIINRTITTFIEVPTAEEVLDDFDTAFEGWLASMSQSGLSDIDVARARELRNDFLGDYLGELANRALAGEDPFKVVGVEGERIFLGEVEGATTTEEGRTVTQEEIDRQTKEDINRKVDSQSTVSQDVTQDGETQEAAGKATEREQTAIDAKTNLEQDTVGLETTKTDITETERIVQIPNITPVRAFSTTDFLEKRFGGDTGKIATFLGGKAGRREGTRRRGLGVRAGASRV